jgi:signal transduction histidine kinase
LGLLYLYRRIRAKNAELSRLNERYNQQNTELTAFNQRMERFTHTLSHDALGYTNNILNYATLGVGSEYMDEVTPFFRKIHNNATNMKKMAQNLIQFNSFGTTPHADNLDLNTVVTEVIDNINERLGENPIIIKDLVLPRVYADREFLKQIFQNIVGNSVKFKRKDTPLQLVVLAREQADYVEIKVQDNGIGIASDKMSNVFKEFTKLNKSAEGSGLGLFICQQMVERMGGKIWAEAVTEGGTAIYFTLPMAKK